jgi:O-antigen ligase
MAVKKPESEPARLVHNDYLEQASDSGLPGFLSYGAFIVCGLGWTFRRWWMGRVQDPQSWLVFGVWLGLFGWALHGLIEFGLYIPGEAWIVFTLFGWLLQRPEGESRMTNDK